VVHTPEDLVDYLRVSDGGSKIPAAMNQLPHLVQLLQNYGICLSTTQLDGYCQQPETDLLAIGTVMSLPGGVLHGGPASTGYRAVLFWLAHGESNDIYDIDEQYFDGLLLTDLLLPLWRFISTEDRYRFLQLLHSVSICYPALSTHFMADNETFGKFLVQLTNQQQPEDFIRSIAFWPNLAHVPVLRPLRNEWLVCVSKPNLVLMKTYMNEYDSTDELTDYHPIAIYRRSNQSVIIQVCHHVLLFVVRTNHFILLFCPIH
jgi:hypothetical protein